MCTSVQVGDHVSASFIPSCGRCRYCSTGRQNLCDHGAGAFLKGMITDGTSRHRLDDGSDVMLFAKLGTFSEYSCVAESQVIKVEPDLPLEAVALVSCGVATGWGSATKRADVAPGDTVVVVGIGGIGINAVQGAAMAGARHVIAIDPVEFKREKAMEFGATHTFASMEEALPEVMELSWGHDGRQGDHDPRRDVRRHDGARYPARRQGRHDRRHGRRADDADRVVGQPVRDGDVQQGDQGHDLRVAQPAGRHPQAARACIARASSSSTN